MSRIAFAALLFALPTAIADEPKAPDYFPLAKGNKWEYEATSGDQKVMITITVTALKVEKGRRIGSLSSDPASGILDSVDFYADEKGIAGSIIPDLKMDPPWPLLKYPVKVGDSWNDKIKIKNTNVVIITTVKETAEVKVPAGTYKAVPVETGALLEEAPLGITTWYADGLGMVQMKLVYGVNVVELKLKKFTPAK